MVGVAAISTPIWVSSPTKSKSKSKSRAPKTGFTEKFPQNPAVVPFQAFPFLSAVQHYKAPTHFSLKAAAASSSSSSGTFLRLLKFWLLVFFRLENFNLYWKFKCMYLITLLLEIESLFCTIVMISFSGSGYITSVDYWRRRRRSSWNH